MTLPPPHLPSRTCSVPLHRYISTLKVVLLSVLIGIMAGAAAALAVIAWVPSLFPLSDGALLGNRTLLLSGTISGRGQSEDVSSAVWNAVRGAKVLFYASQTKKTTLGADVKAFSARDYIGAGMFVTSDGWLIAPRSLGVRARELVLVGDHQELRVTRVVHDSLSGISFIKVEGDNFSVVPFVSAAAWLEGPWWVEGKSFTRIENPVWRGADTSLRRASGFDADTIARWPTSDALAGALPGTPVVNVRGELVGVVDVVAGEARMVPLSLITPVFTKVFLSQPLERSRAQFTYTPLEDWELVDVPAYLKKMSGGALVRTVAQTAQTELMPGDVVRSVEGIEVYEGRDLGLILATFKDKGHVRADVVRDGKEETVDILFGAVH